MSVIRIRNWEGAVAGHGLIIDRCARHGLAGQQAEARRFAFVRTLKEGGSVGRAIQAGNRGLRAYTVQGGAA